MKHELSARAKVETLGFYRREIERFTKLEKALANELRLLLQLGLDVPGVKLSDTKRTAKWASGALQTAQEISPDLTTPTLVDIKSVDPELLDECKRHGIVEYKTPQPRVLLDKPANPTSE